MSWILLAFVFLLLTLAFPRLFGCLVTLAIMAAVFLAVIGYFLVGDLHASLDWTGAVVIGGVAALVTGAVCFDLLVRR